ncbi:hypothetical protein NKJ93_04815 [Mesorhizobium sp. M0028]|uniref:MBL fold metallo-hydrolase n=1 Tax=Mesorhizobium sp. M0028 TaxID=2956849 RepID=UPI00333D2B90
MIITIIGSSPGESAILMFSDGAIITIDCCKRKNKNFMVEYFNDQGLDFAKVSHNVITHFHNDHVAGMDELINACPNSKVVLPDLWRSIEFKHFAARLTPDVSTGPGTVITEVLKVFDILEKARHRVDYGAELTCLYPAPHIASATGERLTVVSPTNFRKTNFLASLAQALGKSDADLRRFGVEDQNDASMSFLIQDGGSLYFLGGDLQNIHPHCDIDQIHTSHATAGQNYGLVKIPHHGSSTSFSALLRAKVKNNETKVVITPYPQGHKRLPSKETATYLNGVLECYVLEGEIMGLARSDRTIASLNIVPVREYRPGVAEYCDGSITLQRCVTLEKYLSAHL